MSPHFDHNVLVLCLLVASAVASSINNESKFHSLDPYLASRYNLQSWNDWLTKRDQGGQHGNVEQFKGDQHGNVEQFQRVNSQKLQKYVHKRAIGSPALLGNFGVFDNTKFQDWKDWVSKRGFDSRYPFSGFSDLDKNQFQQWNDWVSKRNFDIGNDGFGRGPSTTWDLQNWADFVKRQNFRYPSSDMGMSGSAHFQDWQDWVKRMNTDETWALRAYRFGNKDHFIKRQLGFSPDRYGSFSRYFTDGLQDWRSTFRSVKRNKDHGEKSGEQ